MTMPIRVRARLHQWNNSIQLLVGTQDRKAVMVDATFQKLEEGEAPPDTGLLRIEPTEAQALMDDLWACGVRPTDGAGSAGAMAQAQERIRDLKESVGHLRVVEMQLIGELRKAKSE